MQHHELVSDSTCVVPDSMSDEPSIVVAGEDWMLVTAPDEQRRCCVLVRGQRCEHATSFRIASADGALDDYTYVCRCHFELVRRAEDVVTSAEN
jgi:hypothetical protein